LATSRFGGQASNAYETLRGRILDGKLGPGVRIRVRETAAGLGMSIAPVRDALIALAHEGLVEGGHGTDWVVARVTREKIDNAIMVRAALEVESARQASQKAGPEDIKNLMDLGREIDSRYADGLRETGLSTELDSRFHLAIAQLSGSECLCREIERWKVVLDWKRLYVDGGRWAAQSHVKVAEAIASGDADFAERQMRRHILYPWQDVKAVVGEPGTPIPDVPAEAVADSG